MLANHQFSSCLFERHVADGMKPKRLCHVFFKCGRFE